MSTADDARYQSDLKTPALSAIAKQQEVIRKAEEKAQRERDRLAELVYEATEKTEGKPLPYGRVEHVARLLGVKRDRVAKIRAAVRKKADAPADPDRHIAGQSMIRVAA